MSLQDKAAERDKLIAEVRKKLEEYRASGRRFYLKSTIPLEQRSIRQLRDVLRYWEYQERKLTQPEPPQADPMMGVGTSKLRAVVEEMESQEQKTCSNQQQEQYK